MIINMSSEIELAKMHQENYYLLQKKVFELRNQLQLKQMHEENKELQEQHGKYLELRNRFETTISDLAVKFTKLEECNVKETLKCLPSDYINVPISHGQDVKEVIEKMREIMKLKEENPTSEFPVYRKEDFDVLKKHLKVDCAVKLCNYTSDLLMDVEKVLKKDVSTVLTDGDNERNKSDCCHNSRSDDLNFLKVIDTEKRSDNLSDCTINTFSEESVVSSSPVLK